MQKMSLSINRLIQDKISNNYEPLFPYAPEGWSSDEAEKMAELGGIGTMDEIHWRTIICLQEYFQFHDSINIRELHDALEEKFHLDGGLKALYAAFPKGPIAQGCRLAGLISPAGAINSSFGSMQ